MEHYPKGRFEARSDSGTGGGNRQEDSSRGGEQLAGQIPRDLPGGGGRSQGQQARPAAQVTSRMIELRIDFVARMAKRYKRSVEWIEAALLTNKIPTTHWKESEPIYEKLIANQLRLESMTAEERAVDWHGAIHPSR